MAAPKKKLVSSSNDDFDRIMKGISKIPAYLVALKKKTGTPLVVFRDGKIQHIKPEDIQI
ncbi:hypothetical protein SKC38_00640 [Aquirufa sp. PLAD-142S6K]|jgi:hypothetical protein|uniref:Uncharacterized protein n=1 Tax=Aquirufa echingensis TaxID=3096516 RepID=A0ABW6CUV3_9BACT